MIYTQKSLFAHVAGDDIGDWLIGGAVSDNAQIAGENSCYVIVLQVAYGDSVLVCVLYYHNVVLLRLAHRVVPLNHVEKFNIFHILYCFTCLTMQR